MLLRSIAAAARVFADTYSHFAFPHRGGQFRGVYGDFRQAEAAAPGGKKIGYDHWELAREYQNNLNLRLESFDYPILFHLDRIIDGCRSVLDFGGNVGVHYLRYRRHLKLDHVKWTVLDLPEITAAGRQTCAGLPNISFMNRLEDFPESRLDVLFASGSMQYLPSPALPLQTMIDRRIRPSHVLINRLPLYCGPQFVTLQNGGLTYYPQHVFNCETFITSIESLGYELVDAWPDTADSCVIPFHPARSILTYTGLYFQAAEDARARQALARNNAAGKMIGTT